MMKDDRQAVITCGGLIIAEKLLIPNMPRLDIVNVPPCTDQHNTLQQVAKRQVLYKLLPETGNMADEIDAIADT